MNAAAYTPEEPIAAIATALAPAALGIVRAQIESQTQAALDRAAELEQENAELTDKIDAQLFGLF